MKNIFRMVISTLFVTVLSLCVSPAAEAQGPIPVKPSPVDASHRLLLIDFQWERGSFAAHFNPTIAAFKAAGYTVDEKANTIPAPTPDDLLEKYDVICVTTRCGLCANLPWIQAISEFVRQGGAFVVIVTSDVQSWDRSLFQQILPCTLDGEPGPGWYDGATWTNIKMVPTRTSGALSDLGWAGAPGLIRPSMVAPPDDEIFRGADSLLEPREDLVKPLIDCDWRTLLTANDAEHTPLAVMGSYGRGHILVWGPGFGGNADGSGAAPPLSMWPQLPALWSRLLEMVTDPGKTRSPEPAVFVCGSDLDNPSGEAWNGMPWEFHHVMSYPLEDLGMTRTEDIPAADGALILATPDADQANAIATLAAAGKPIMVSDPDAFSGALAAYSPFLADQSAGNTNQAAVPGNPDDRATITLGDPVPAPPSPAPPPKPAQPTPVTDAGVQPPTLWKFDFTNDPTSTRDLREKWYSPDWSDNQWDTRKPGGVTQLIDGKPVPYTGAVWYRAHVTLGNGVQTTGWLIDVGNDEARVDAWVDGRHVSTEPTQNGAILPLSGVGTGAHLLALRVYSSGGSTYWEGSKWTYDNSGIRSITAVRLPVPQPPIRTADDLAPGPRPAPKEPELFTDRANGDKDFHFTFNLDANQASQTPLIVFHEPGLIQYVRVNGQRINAEEQGAWDGVSPGNTSAFLLHGVLKPGANTLDFHPDFNRYRGMDFPLTQDAVVECSLPTLQFDGALQCLLVDDPALGPAPMRLFAPGEVRTPRPDCQIIARWNDGRPALVRRGNVMAWTSNMTGQMNSAQLHRWQVSAEASGHWDFQAADGTPRGDSLIFENLAPLMCRALADQIAHPTVSIKVIRRHAAEGAADLVVGNSAAEATTVKVVFRVFDWLGGFVSTSSRMVSLAPNGETVITYPIQPVDRLGEGIEDRYLIRASVRSSDGSVGYAYAERIINLPPPIRLSIVTDSLARRRAAGSIPDRLKYNADYRGRHLWWPLIDVDQGSYVYVDGETCHATVSATNTTNQSIDVTLTASFSQPLSKKQDTSNRWKITLAPGESRSFTIAQILTGSFEPYLITLRCDSNGLPPADTKLDILCLQPDKQAHDIDNPPVGHGFSFTVYNPLTYLEIPDDPIPTQAHDVSFGNYPPFMDWTQATATGTQGNGGGTNGYTGMTDGLSWGPFYNPSLHAPNEMSAMPNGEPYLHYIAGGLHRQRSHPGTVEVADYWGDYRAPVNWSTINAFDNWLRTNHPAEAADFHPRTYSDCLELLKTTCRTLWDEWQNVMVCASWESVEASVPKGSQFWSQAELTYVATNGAWNAASQSPYDGGPIVNMLAHRDVAGDADPGTSRMGLGFRFREYAEATTAAMAPDAHFNPTTLRHQYFLNDQHLKNQGYATVEEFRAEAYDTLFSATVRSDGSLRAMLDTPNSETALYPNGPATAAEYGDRIYDRMYRLGSVLQPQAVLGLLWVTPLHRDPPGAIVADPRSIYETLRNNGVCLSAMISPDNLATAFRTGASGVVWLLPYNLKPAEISAIQKILAHGLAVICIAPPAHQRVIAQLPLGVHVLNLPSDVSLDSPMSPDQARSLAKAVITEAKCPVTASPGVCITAFRSNGHRFAIVQNMWPIDRTVTVAFPAPAGKQDQLLTAFDVDSSASVAVAGADISVPIGPWDSQLIVFSK